jgi:ADP-ribosylglycohydrolase
MRVFPILMTPWRNSAALVDAAVRQSRVTHGHPRSHVACAMYCLWVEGLPRFGSAGSWAMAEDVMRSGAFSDDVGLSDEEIEFVLDSTWRSKATGSGYVVDTLWSARVALEESTDFATCVRRAIAFGHDTDTTAAVAGAAASVLYGLESIPRAWRDALRGRDVLDPLMARWRSSLKE